MRPLCLLTSLLLGACSSDPPEDSEAETDSPQETGGTGATSECLEECYPQSLSLSTETDVEELAPWSCVSGDLRVEGSQLSTLELPCLTEVSGILVISSNGLLTEVDLPRLERAGGMYTHISKNDHLEDLDLPSLHTVTGLFHFAENPALTSLQGLSGLRTVNNEFTIYRNNGLTSLEGLEGLEYVKSLKIDNNHGLESLRGLEGVELGDDLDVHGNSSLASLEGLQHLTEVPGDLDLEVHPLLTDLEDLASLERIGGRLGVRANTSLPYCTICALLAQLEEPPTQVGVDRNLDDDCGHDEVLTCE